MKLFEGVTKTLTALLDTRDVVGQHHANARQLSSRINARSADCIIRVLASGHTINGTVKFTRSPFHFRNQFCVWFFV